MSKSNGTENSIFQTELKDAKIEPSKLPPLNPKKNNKTSVVKENIINIENSSSVNKSSNNTTTINNENSDTINNNEEEDIIYINENNNQTDNNNTNNNDDINTDGNDTNDNDNVNIDGNDDNTTNHNTVDDSNDNNENNDDLNDGNNQNENNDQTDKDNKEEIKIGDDDDGDGILQEQASVLIGSITGENNQSNSDTSKDTSNQDSDNESKSKSQQQSSKTSQKNSTKSSTTNSLHNSVPISNRSSSSLTSHSYSASRSNPKTALAQRRLGKLPSSKISFNQEMSKIPKDILHNPYVTKRLNIFPPRKTNPPKAALSHVEYRNRTAPQTDELTEKILNGEKLDEEPTLEQLKNSANILRNIEKDLIDKSQYPEAKKAAEAFQKTLRLIKKKTSSNEVKTDLEDLISKRNELILLADSRKEDWDDAISKYQSNTEAHIRDMKQQHQEKIEKFNSEIPSELTPLFKRNSVSYLTMRSNEKYLALNRHFDEAQKIKIKADQIEEIEREENFSKMDEYYRRKRDKMKQLQDLEIVNYLSYADTRKNELIFQKQKSISPPLQRAERIDREIKRICEKRGIKQNQLNFDLVDDERVKLIKSKEKENEEIFQRSENSKNQTKYKKKKNSEDSKNDKSKDDKSTNKLEEEEEEDKNKKDEEEQKNEINDEEEQKNDINDEEEQKNETNEEEEQKNSFNDKEVQNDEKPDDPENDVEEEENA